MGPQREFVDLNGPGPWISKPKDQSQFIVINTVSHVSPKRKILEGADLTDDVMNLDNKYSTGKQIWLKNKYLK